jgi:Fe-S oxidoreductase
MCLSGFVLEGLRMTVEAGPAEPWAFAGTAVARWLRGATVSNGAGLRLYKALWWSHAVTAFALLAAIPYIPLRHIFTAPLHLLLSPTDRSGKLRTPFDLKQLMEAQSFDVRVGVGSIDDFGSAERLGLAACADFGGCQDVCPAHATGTPLSPMRLIDMLRQQSEAAGRNPAQPTVSLDRVVDPEEVWSCTLCGACAQSCPTLVDPLQYIIELRRGLIQRHQLDQRKSTLLSHLAHTGNPYGVPASERSSLTRQLGVQSLQQNPKVELLYWIGCSASFDPRARRIAHAMVKILKQAGIHFGILAAEEGCSGDPARRLGEEGMFQEMVYRNLETFERYRVQKILTHCAHCFNTFRNEYPEFGARLEVVHHSALIQELLQRRKLELGSSGLGRLTLHDSCYLARFNRSVEAPRQALRSIRGLSLVEMGRSAENTFCCGAGGANYWYSVPRRETMAAARLRQATATGARTLVTECPFCLKMFENELTATRGPETLQVLDLAEVVAGALDASESQGVAE